MRRERDERVGARRFAAALVAVALATAGCARDGEPAIVALTAGFAPTFEPEPGAVWGVDAGSGAPLRWWPEDDESSDLWVGATIERDAWESAAVPGLWVTRRPLGNFVLNLDADGAVRLLDGDREFGPVPYTEDLMEFLDRTPRGSFTPVRDDLFLLLGDDEQPPATLEYRLRLRRGAPTERGWRVPFGPWTVAGLPVWTGMREVVTVDVPAESALRFATGTLAVAAPAADDGGEQGLVRFTVRLDGELVFEHAQAIAPRGRWERHVVPLPAGRRRGAELEFAVEGDPALGCIGTPTVGPAGRGHAAADDRPDILVLLADTFRADNMTTYGGERALTPRLDALADESLVFLRARSPAMWTLPAHGSLFTGLWPHEHTAVTYARSLPDEAHTIAEHLADAGYRTGAITDAGFVGRNFGLDQGFDWFDEQLRSLGDTVDAALAFLDADDGRPTFLFVHSYRTHEPYRVSDETRAEHGARLGIEFDYEELVASLRDGDEYWWNDGPVPEWLRPLIPPYRALYDGSVMDLDRGFGALLDAAEARGFGRDAFVVFTSDHGEAFAEHDTLGHGGGVWEENIRIPLLLRGPGVEPRRSEDAATLVDLAVTLADAAGVAPDPAWRGRSLLTLDEDRTVFAFQCGASARRDAALIAGRNKLLAPTQDGGLAALETLTVEDLRAAFDLGADPAEQLDVLDATARPAWPAALLEAHRSRWAELVKERFAPREATTGFADQEALRRLGYLDDG